MSEGGVAIKVQVDMQGQMKKSAAIRKIPRAFRYNATSWASKTVRYIKQELRGGAYFKRAPKEIDQRLGMKVQVQGAERAEILIGTGHYIGRQEVVYADIQERGGWIFPRKAKALTIPFPGVKGVARNYPNSFIMRTKAGNSIIAMKTGKRGRIRPLFLLAKSVRLPARHWFTRPIAERMPDLDRAMSPEGVWATAAQMAHARTTAQGGE